MSDFPVMQYKAPEPEDILPDIDAHGYLQGVYRGQIKPNGNRLRAAIASIQYEKPKLGAVIVGSAGDLAERLEHAVKASQKVINSQVRQQIIEHEPSPVSEAPEPAPDHAKPFASDLK